MIVLAYFVSVAYGLASKNDLLNQCAVFSSSDFTSKTYFIRFPWTLNFGLKWSKACFKN